MATYRFYVQLQKGKKNLATSGGEFSAPPNNSEAISVVEGIRSKGKSEVPRGARNDFESAVDDLISWIKNIRGTGMSFSGNGDQYRKTFKHDGEEYRLDIGIGGEGSRKWFV
jgi:hypothetical protein